MLEKLLSIAVATIATIIASACHTALGQTDSTNFMPLGGKLVYDRIVSGRLDSNALTVDGSYYANFYFQGSAGDEIEIYMSSSDFDPYLVLFSPIPEADLLSNALDNWRVEDDDSGDGLNSLIRTTLPEDGEYTIAAVTGLPNQTGNFDLRLTRISGNGADGYSASNVVDGINFGINTSRWANDGQCDDPRFEGLGVSGVIYDNDIQADATDCLNAYLAGTARLK